MLQESSALIYLSHFIGKYGYVFSRTRKWSSRPSIELCLCHQKYYPIGLDSIAPQRLSTWSSDKSHMLAHTIAPLKIAGTLPFSTSTLVLVYSFPLKPLPLFRLTSVSPPTLFFLVSAHTCAQCDINAWRCGEAETLGYLDQIEPVDVKDRPQTVRGVRL